MVQLISSLKKSVNNLRNRIILRSIYIKYKDFTMIPKDLYLENLGLCNDLFPGDGAIVECGVWRGGMIAGIADYINSKGNAYYIYDSFQGLPDAKDIDGKKAKDWQMNISGPYYYDNCRTDQAIVESLFRKLNVSYHIYKGWFNETLPFNKPKGPISILRLDADWYESTMVCLDYLYPCVKQDGLIIIDDYFAWEGCSKAVHDYLSKINSTSKIRQTRFGVTYIIKNEMR